MAILRDNWGWCGKSIARFRQIIWWLSLKLNGWFACFAVLRLRSHNPDQSSRYMVHGLQLTTQLCYKTLEFEKFLGLSELGEATECFRVVVSTLGSMICVCISLIITQGHLSAYRSSIIRSVILLTAFDRACHSGGHYWDFCPGALSLGQVTTARLKIKHP